MALGFFLVSSKSEITKRASSRRVGVAGSSPPLVGGARWSSVSMLSAIFNRSPPVVQVDGTFPSTQQLLDALPQAQGRQAIVTSRRRKKPRRPRWAPAKGGDEALLVRRQLDERRESRNFRTR
eukprot:1373375-Prymnesium_polylepis.1